MNMENISEGGILPVFPIVSGAESIGERLALVHAHVKVLPGCEMISRVAFAAYATDTDYLSTYVASDDNPQAFSLYATPLDKTPSLKHLADSGDFRIVDDICATYSQHAGYSRAMCSTGLRSSLTFPVKSNGMLHGFLFLNASEPAYFSPRTLKTLAPYVALISLMMINEMAPMNALRAAVNMMRGVSSQRDDETGSHLLRMAAYVRLIATELARRHAYPDDWVDLLVRCAPLHDVGKISVPDGVLHKPGRLDPQEREVMQRHVQSGVDIALMMLDHFRIDRPHICTMLHEVVAQHHETLDGSGYPNRLTDESISIEARIVAVADIFDALTTERVYKAGWPVDKALEYVRSIAGVKLDEECVEILVANLDAIVEIRARYTE
jgi:HD-GYP domain-containing protein (c-di-GMP phosphodiesterase class II)